MLMANDLMNIRALPVWTRSGALPGTLAYLQVKLNWQFLGWVTGIVVTSLIFEFSMDGVGAGGSGSLRNDHRLHDHITRVNAQLLCGIKRETGQLSRGILHFSDNQIRRRGESQRSRN